MRSTLIPLLAATILAPASAAAGDFGQLGGFRTTAKAQPNPATSSADTPQVERPVRAIRVDRPGQFARRFDAEPPVRVGATEPAVGVFRSRGPDAGALPVQVDTPIGRRSRTVTVMGDERPDQRRDDGFVRVFRGTGIGTPVDVRRDHDLARSQAPGVQAQHGEGGTRDDHRRWRDGDRDGRRWTGDWRRDHRYDWRGHRDRHRWMFRIGNFYDPYGWGYQPWSIGYRLWPSYYRSSFWLDDPWRYRLPPAHGRYRWIRYYNDALLVDIHSGRVVDVIHGFFW